MPHPDMNESWVGGHPDEGLLHEWLDEQLGANAAAEMQSHVASCASCQARVAEARGLIAASHHILSALDEVPAHVIPTNIAATARSDAGTNTGALPERAIVVAGVTSIDEARGKSAAKSTTKSAAPSKRVISWNSLGKIAAVLVFAVAIAKSGFMVRGDVTVPMPAVQQEAAPTDAKDVAAEIAKSATSRSALASIAESIAATPSQKATGSAASTGAANAMVADKVADDSRAVRERVVDANVDAMVNADAKANADAGVVGRLATEKRKASEPERSPLVLSTPTVTSLTVAPPAASAQTAGAQVASAPVAPALLASPRVASSPAASPPVASPPPGAGVAGGRAMRAKAASEAVTNAGASAAPAAGFAANAMRAVRSGFDSVTLMRTVCGTTCESSTIHINTLGDVRYAVGSGNSQRVVMSKLTTTARDSISALLVRTFPDSTVRQGRTRCEISGREAVQLTVDYSEKLPARANNRCEQSNDELREFGMSVDAIVGIDALKLRLPRPEH